MAYTKKEWKDRKTEYPNRRMLTKEDSSKELVTVSREEGAVSEEGDAFSAENMNDLEDRIAEAVNPILQTITVAQIVTALPEDASQKTTTCYIILEG